MFDRYEEDVRTQCVTLTKMIGRLETLSGDERREHMRQISKAFREADETVEQMQMEARGAAAPARATMTARIREVSAELSATKQALRKTEDAFIANAGRSELFEGLRDDQAAAGSRDQRQRLIQTTEKLERGRGMIKDAHKTVLETEEMGRDILTTLEGQREQIQHTRATLHATDENVSRARTLLNSIARRIMTNKCILVIIILVILAIIGIVVWLVWFNDGPPPNPANRTLSVSESFESFVRTKLTDLMEADAAAADLH